MRAPSLLFGGGVAVGVIAFAIAYVNAAPSPQPQLDLPSLPGPPYPDPRGQNRWGVKFDPRKHGPPFDMRPSVTKNSIRSRDPETKLGMRRPFRGKDSYFAPARMRAYLKRPPPHRRRNNRPHRHYNKDMKRRRPRHHGKVHQEESWEEKEPSVKVRKPMHKQPSREEKRQFWEKWNAWYQKQIDAKEQLKKGKKIHFPKDEEDAHPPPMTYYIDAEEFEKYKEDDAGEDDNDSGPRSSIRYIRDYYANLFRSAVRKAKSLANGGEEEQAKEDEDGWSPGSGSPGEGKSSKQGGWAVFTTIGKGLDAANDAMGTVRKTVGGSLVGTGIKYGGKMAMDAMMNVGTSALTTALKSATPFG